MPITIQPNARVVQAIEKARSNDVKGVMSVIDIAVSALERGDARTATSIADLL